MKVRSRAARRYAKALHDLATEAAALEAVSSDMAGLKGHLAESPELGAFVGNYLIPAAGRDGVLKALFEARLHPLSWRFVRFLESKRRLGLLADVAADFLDQEEARRGIVRGVLASAFPVLASEADAMAGRLAGRWGRQLVLKTEEMPELLGGCRLQVGDTVYDFSLAARLRMLRQTMMAG